MEPKDQIFSIDQASQRLGLPKHTMRFWEKEFQGTFVPPRTPGGQRRYTLNNISFLEGVKKQREQGLGLAEIKRRLNDPGQADKGSSVLNKIDLLSLRITEVIKTEILSFFKREEEIREKK